MDCNICREKMMFYVDGSLKDDLAAFEEHLKNCPHCSVELSELEDALGLIKDKDVFCPDMDALVDFANKNTKDATIEEHLKTCEDCRNVYRELKLQIENIGQPERAEIDLPQPLLNAVKTQYGAAEKEKQMPAFGFSLKFAYAMALILCLGLGLYITTFVYNPASVSLTEKPVPKKPAVELKKEMPAVASKTTETLRPKTQEKKAAADAPVFKTEKPAPTPAKDAAILKEIENMPQKPDQEQTQIAAPLNAKGAYAPAREESFTEPSLKEKADKIIADYKGVKVEIKREASSVTITLLCSKNTNNQIIEEIKTKLSTQLNLQKDRDKIIVITE